MQAVGRKPSGEDKLFRNSRVKMKGMGTILILTGRLAPYRFQKPDPYRTARAVPLSKTRSLPDGSRRAAFKDPILTGRLAPCRFQKPDPYRTARAVPLLKAVAGFGRHLGI
jgi:hypothetical protein